MAPFITADEYLEVNSVPLATPAWRIIGLSPLLDDAPTRGENEIIPHAQGRLENPLYVDQWPLALNMIINGTYKDDGTLHTNPRMGLITNRETLDATIGIRQSVTAVWHRFDGSTRTATVQVIGFTTSTKTVALGRLVLNLIVPAGVLGAVVP